METRLSGGDIALEPQNDDARGAVLRAHRLPGRRQRRAHRASSRPSAATGWPATASSRRSTPSTPRSRRIVEERWLKVNDDSSGGMTLHELAGEYGVSAERIRQIEVAAMKKMRKALAETLRLPPSPGSATRLASENGSDAGAVSLRAWARFLTLPHAVSAAASGRTPAPRRRRRSARTGAPCPCVSNTKRRRPSGPSCSCPALARHLRCRRP